MLDLQVLNDGFDHKVDVGELLDVVLKVARGHKRRVVLVEEERGLRLDGLCETTFGESVSLARDFLVGIAQPGGHDVQQHHLNASVSEMRGDTAAHYACADDAHSANRLGHLLSLLR